MPHNYTSGGRRQRPCPWQEMRPPRGPPRAGGCSGCCGSVAEDCWTWVLRGVRGGQAPRRPPQVCPPLTLLRPPDPQNMEKVAAPSVTLIVGCGVSSLTLLMLIIIYVSVWR